MKTLISLPLDQLWDVYNLLGFKETLYLRGADTKDETNLVMTKNLLTITVKKSRSCDICECADICIDLCQLQTNDFAGDMLDVKNLHNIDSLLSQEQDVSLGSNAISDTETIINTTTTVSPIKVQSIEEDAEEDDDFLQLNGTDNADDTDSVQNYIQGSRNYLKKQKSSTARKALKKVVKGKIKRSTKKTTKRKPKGDKTDKWVKKAAVAKQKIIAHRGPQLPVVVKLEEGADHNATDYIETDGIDTSNQDASDSNKKINPRLGSEFGTVLCKICHIHFMDERGREGHVRMYHKLTIDQYNVMTEEEIKIAADKVKETLRERQEKRKLRTSERMNNSAKKQKKEPKKYHCELCQTKLPYKTIILHLKNIHKDNAYSLVRMCEIDSENSNGSEIRNTTFSFVCPFCQNLFYGSCVLRHMTKFHADEASFEEQYKQIFEEDRVNRMKLSMLYPRKEGSYICEWCNKEFNKIGAFNRHKKLLCKLAPHQPKIYKCKQCSYYSGEQAFLDDHIKKRHSADQKYICEICAAEFYKQERYTLHMRRKHNKVFKAQLKSCNHCGKVFAFNLMLQEHIARFHSDARDFLCEECPKSFKVREDLSKHVRIVHRKAYRYRCERCNHGMDRKQYLATHKCGRVRRKDAEEVWDDETANTVKNKASHESKEKQQTQHQSLQQQLQEQQQQLQQTQPQQMKPVAQQQSGKHEQQQPLPLLTQILEINTVEQPINLVASSSSASKTDVVMPLDIVHEYLNPSLIQYHQQHHPHQQMFVQPLAATGVVAAASTSGIDQVIAAVGGSGTDTVRNFMSSTVISGMHNPGLNSINTTAAPPPLYSVGPTWSWVEAMKKS